MGSVVSDTDAASFVVKDDPIRSPRYVPHFRARIVVLPFSTVAELRLGAELRSWGQARRGRLEQFIGACIVHYPDDALCAHWARLVAQQQRLGRPIEKHDAWVAATALHLSLPLVTHNARHYAGVPGLQVITEPDATP
jgi:predicted nucleic acid-binding protein